MDLRGWLQSLSLERFEAAFRKNEIDDTILPNLTAEDLMELGVKAVGDRRKLLEAIAVLSADASAKNPSTTYTSGKNSADRRQVTVMFTGLVNSTTLSADTGSQPITGAISAGQQRVAEVVRFYDGFVVKNLNDGVLACFGYPQVHEDDVERTILAGAQVIRAVADIEAPSSLQARVGIATGIVVVNDLIGTGAAHERGIIGEARKLAARRPESAEPNTIVISESAQKRHGKFEDLGTKDLKGISIGQIAETAKVPPERRLSFWIGIANTMIHFIREHERMTDPKLLNEQIKRWKKELKQMAKARSSMATAALELKSAIAKFDEKYGEAVRCVFVAPPIDTLLSEVQEWMNTPPPIAAQRAEWRKGRGRPSRPTYAPFHTFLCLLLVIVNVEGGKLTFNKNYPRRGTLVRFLNLLRPHMPRGFIPEIPPVRVLIEAQKVATGGIEALEAMMSSRRLPAVLDAIIETLLEKDWAERKMVSKKLKPP